MKYPASRLSRLIPVLIALGAVAHAQTQPGSNPNTPSRPSPSSSHTIRGKIFLPSGGLPDQRIRVVLELNTGGIAGEAFSDSIGNFEFRSLPSNSYRVTVPSDNQTFETTQETVEVYGNFSRTFVVQVYLREKGSDQSLKTKEKLLSVADIQEVPKAAKKAYEKGVKQARDLRHEEAIKQFEEALKAFPDYLLAINKLGEQYRALKRNDEAQTAFERAIAINGKYALPRINLGILYVEQKRFAEAITHLEEAIRRDESYPMAHLYLGLALMETQPPELDRAERELQRALESGGRDFSHVRLHLFNLNFRRRTWDKAAQQLESFLKESPDAPNAPAVRETLGKLRKMIAQQTSPAKQ
jgi:tetratricopeptide (TPR) repeat protein